jgi:hypothetical protein
MPDSLSPALGLPLPIFGQANWSTELLAWAAMLDAQSMLGPLGVYAKEFPSTTLNVVVAAGSYLKADGTAGTYAGTASRAMTASSTNTVYLTDAGTLTVNTSGIPAGVNCVPLATVTTDGSTVTGVADLRGLFRSRGAHPASGLGTPTIAAGAGAGTSPTVSVVPPSSDGAGHVSVATGTSPSASAVVATVTFGVAFAAAPRSVLLRPANAAAAALSGAGSVWADSAGVSATAWTLNVGSSALAGATTYLWWYSVEG